MNTVHRMLTTFPQCIFSLEFPEILSENHIYAIIDWSCLKISKIMNHEILINMLYRMFHKYHWSKIMSITSIFYIIIRSHHKMLIIKWCLHKNLKSLPLWQKTYLGYRIFKLNTLHKYIIFISMNNICCHFLFTTFLIVKLGTQ